MVAADGLLKRKFQVFWSGRWWQINSKSNISGKYGSQTSQILLECR